MKKKQSELKTSEKDYSKDRTVLEAAQRECTKARNELTRLGYEEGKREALSNERRKLAGEVHRLRDAVETLEARFPQLQFDYRDPERNFDRSRVKGLVAKLIKVKDASTATALEVAAGGKVGYLTLLQIGRASCRERV